MENILLRGRKCEIATILDVMTYAVMQHKRKFNGVRPKQFEMHPTLISCIKIKGYNYETQLTSWMGVPIVAKYFRQYPVIITCKGVTEYL